MFVHIVIGGMKVGGIPLCNLYKTVNGLHPGVIS